MRLAIGFRFASHWLRKFFQPITKRSKANPMQTRITLVFQLKIALKKAQQCYEHARNDFITLGTVHFLRGRGGWCLSFSV